MAEDVEEILSELNHSSYLVHPTVHLLTTKDTIAASSLKMAMRKQDKAHFFRDKPPSNLFREVKEKLKSDFMKNGRFNRARVYECAAEILRYRERLPEAPANEAETR